jgi:hypothetical protein
LGRHPTAAERAAFGWHYDSQKIEHSGPDGAPVAIEASADTLDVKSMSFEDREALRGNPRPPD